MNILLTGPFGTIGTHVLDELLARGHRVTCFDLDNQVNRKVAKRHAGKVSQQWGDITRADDVNRAVQNQDAVVHLAAIIPPLSESNPALAEKVNVQGTQLVIDTISAQAKPPLLVFPSSISVHGFSNTRQPPCTVETPLDARDHYAGHKIECEKRLRASNIPWIILRIGACADATNQKTGDMEAMLRHMFTLDAQTRIEYLHPKDAAIAIANALVTPAAIGKTLFLGSGRASQSSWLEFVNIVPRTMGIGELPASAFGRDPYYTDWMDTTESQALLQFQQYGLNAYKKELTQHWRWRRYLLWPVRGLVRRYMLKFAASTA